MMPCNSADLGQDGGSPIGSPFPFIEVSSVPKEVARVFGFVGLEPRVNPGGFTPTRPTVPGASVSASRGWGQCGLLVLDESHLYAYRSAEGTCVLDHERENECQMSDDILDNDILDP
jgi:hypothetical protein